jgi:glutamine amidotransferase
MIAIIDSGGANIASMRFALERCGAEARLTADSAEIESADKVILPGVGMAATAMTQLHQHGLVECIRRLQQPVLGVCLGMQLLFEHSSEGDTEMLGVLAGNCRRFAAATGRSVPHMGWNRIRAIDSGKIDGGNRHPLLTDVAKGAHVYFVHSYFAELSADTIASCDYGEAFTAIAGNGNFMGCQFHPERSGSVGEQILRNFLEL